MNVKHKIWVALAIFITMQGVASAEIIDHEVVYTHSLTESELWSEERREQARAPFVLDSPPLARLQASPPEGLQSRTGDGQQTRADITSAPYKAGGTLFYDKPKGSGKCSAQFVGDGKRVLMTAAHCVMDRKGNWYKNFEFFQGFHLGGGTQIRIECISVESNYLPSDPNDPNEDTNPEYDYAFLYTQLESQGGAIDLQFEIPYERLTAIGYPKDKESGKVMYEVTGTRGRRTGDTIVMNDNTMTRGSSGGAWIGDLGGKNVAVGLNSRTGITYMRSPYFNSTVRSVYQHVKAAKCQ